MNVPYLGSLCYYLRSRSGHHVICGVQVVHAGTGADISTGRGTYWQSQRGMNNKHVKHC